MVDDVPSIDARPDGPSFGRVGCGTVAGGLVSVVASLWIGMAIRLGEPMYSLVGLVIGAVLTARIIKASSILGWVAAVLLTALGQGLFWVAFILLTQNRI